MKSYKRVCFLAGYVGGSHGFSQLCVARTYWQPGPTVRFRSSILRQQCREAMTNLPPSPKGCLRPYRLVKTLPVGEIQAISNRTHWTDPKPVYLITRSQLRAPLGFGPIQYLMESINIRCSPFLFSPCFCYQSRVKFQFVILIPLSTCVVCPTWHSVCRSTDLAFSSTKNFQWPTSKICEKKNLFSTTSEWKLVQLRVQLHVRMGNGESPSDSW